MTTWIMTLKDQTETYDGFGGFDQTTETEAEARRNAHDASVKRFGHDNQGWIDPSKTRCEPWDVFVKRTGYKSPFVYEVSPALHKKPDKSPTCTRTP